MARIQTYQRDSIINDDDIVIGSDSLNNSYVTRNYKMSDIAAYVQAAGAKQKIVGVSDGVISFTGTGNNFPVVFKAVSEDPSTGSLNFNSAAGQLEIDAANGTIKNVSGDVLTLRISTTSFVNVLSNNKTVNYILQLSTNDGGSWVDLKTVQRTKASPGSYADSFWSYFNLADDALFRIVLNGDTNTELDEFSQYEFEVK